MSYDQKSCSNSPYWQNYRLVSIVILGIGMLAFLVISLMLIRYLYKNDKNKRVKKKLTKYFVLIIASLLVFTSGVVLSKHIDNKTKKLAYCWKED